jgi:hypothetical protein
MGNRALLMSMIAVVATGAAAMVAGPVTATPQPQASPQSPVNTCRLGNGVKHVIQIQFDNVHLTRDNPNVPSDLQQMPHLFNFLKRDGVVLTNTHDDLVHTATNFVSNQTGLYPDRTAITQSNSFSYYAPSGSTQTGVSFAYWTDPLFDPSGQARRYAVQSRLHREPREGAEQLRRERACALGAVHPRRLQRR